MSASSSCRNVDSESSTPARKAPIAIDRPLTCMISAAPSTTSSAAAVITSRAWVCGQDAEQRVEQEPAGDDHQQDRAGGDPDLDEAVRTGGVLAARREEGDHRERRDDGEVLEEEDREDLLAVRRRDFAALLEDLHDDRGRGEARGRWPRRTRPAG